MTGDRSQAHVASALRRAFVLLAAGGIVLTTGELASLRHWHGFEQLIPWVSLAVLVGALGLRLGSGCNGRVVLIRVLAAVVLLSALYGVVAHVRANERSGALDRRYEATWSELSAASRWWEAVSGGVGPSPTLAPVALAFAALTLALATLGLGREAQGRPIR